ncbi:hypothetical protein CWB77_08160 [Pseudoalteromonas sp. S1610]|uniref:hypothetical protein n=1 Tax=unclassified Pseudoalteromonas TaxID=194690 RepID=UPI00110A0A90|nr:hypothetical protein [Pseudoalteromonas sp. S1610]TMP61895.1 hypothetical protein CWB77_08160 [Pseudoalteromonas sp. S1610]
MNAIELFSHLSNILTVIAFLFAAYQFFLWRKQQRYSLELDSILNMEDLFEIYIGSLMRAHGYFDKAQKLAVEAHGKSKEERHELNKYLKNEFKLLIEQNNQEINDNANKYGLACFRVKRLDYDIDKIEELDSMWIRDRFQSFLIDKTSLEDVAQEISRIKTVARDEFNKLRKVK